MATKQWVTRQLPGDIYRILDKVIYASNSIWLVVNSGICEYNIKTNILSDPYPFPHQIRRFGYTASCCVFMNNKIYIIGGTNPATIISFDVISKKMKYEIGFTQHTILTLRAGSAAVANGLIHIYGGEIQRRYLIYNPATKRIKRGKNIPVGGKGAAFLAKGQEFIAFGGHHWDRDRFMAEGSGGIELNTFLRGKDIDDAGNVKWTICNNLALKKPMSGFGYIIYKDVIITFGGCTGKNGSGHCGVTDCIYILDMKDDNGWQQSEIKCPEKSRFSAVLIDETIKDYLLVHGWFRRKVLEIPDSLIDLINEFYTKSPEVHLFSFGLALSYHYSISLWSLFGSKLKRKYKYKVHDCYQVQNDMQIMALMKQQNEMKQCCIVL